MAVNEVGISGIAIFGSSETKQSSSMFVSMVDACHSWRECEGENVTCRIRGCTCRKGNDMTLSLQQSDPSKSMACLPLSDRICIKSAKIRQQDNLSNTLVLLKIQCFEFSDSN